MRKLLYLVAAAVAVAWVSVVPANALTCSANCVGMTPNTFTGVGGTGLFGDSTVPTGGFTNQFLFELVSPPDFFDTVSNSITTYSKVIAGLNLSLWECTAGGASSPLFEIPEETQDP